MEFNLKKIIKALLFSTSEAVSIKDIQKVVQRYHAQAATESTEERPTAEPGTEHERTGVPFKCTVQAPHCATPQPNLGPLMLSSSRKAHNNGISGSVSRV